MPYEYGPCSLQTGLLDLARLVINCGTAVMVAWLTVRAKGKDAAEKKRNGNGNGVH